MNWHIPEPMVDLMAQLEDLANPDHVRATMIVTEPRTAVTARAAEHPFLADIVKDGVTLLLNVEKLTKPELFHDLFMRNGPRDEKAMARILGYTRPKNELSGVQRVLQVLRRIDENGNTAVVWEQGIDRACHDETLMRAATFGDVTDVLHPCDALIRRLKLLKSENVI